MFTFFRVSETFDQGGLEYRKKLEAQTDTGFIIPSVFELFSQIVPRGFNLASIYLSGFDKNRAPANIGAQVFTYYNLIPLYEKRHGTLFGESQLNFNNLFHGGNYSDELGEEFPPMTTSNFIRFFGIKFDEGYRIQESGS